MISATPRTQAILRGRSILVARARPGPSAIAATLRALGAEVSELPRVERELLPPPAALLEVIQGRRDGVVVVACEEAAHVVNLALPEASNTASPTLLAVGSGPAAILNRGKPGPLAVTTGACRAELTGLHVHVRGRRLVVLVAERGRPALLRELEHLGGHPELRVIATDVHELPGEWPVTVDLVVLGASSAARALYAHAPEHVFRSPAVAIGAHTESTARALGVRTVVRASDDTRAAVVETAMNLLTGASRSEPAREEGRP